MRDDFMNDPVIKKVKFRNINLDDTFFDNLKESYTEFQDWFKRKENEEAFVTYDNDSLSGFMYLKEENGPITDITPTLNIQKILKVGTFKIEAHGTRLSDRYIKKIFDVAISKNIECIYVTVFKQHETLIERLCEYGFKYHGNKETNNGIEEVFIKDFKTISNNIYLDYPIINPKNKIWLLGIYPQFHTKLFPDSALHTEKNILDKLIYDLTPANSIRKIYIARMKNMDKISQNDVIVIYRTAEKDKPAKYSSVATSLCVVDEVKKITDFISVDEFINYAKYSIFSKSELERQYQYMNNYIIKMTYNVALNNRIIRNDLINQVGIDENAYAGLMEISKEQLKIICKLGGINESLIIY